MKLLTKYVTVLALFVLAGSASADQGENWRPLFDGKSLDGWVQRNGKALYTVEDGTIVGQTVLGEPNSFLCTDKDYANFILEVEYKVDEGMNSGIQIRSQSKPEYNNGRVHGYQVEIDPSSRAWSGGIYDEARRGWLNDLKENKAAGKAFKQGEWNHYRIEAIGASIRTWVNGVPAADLIDSMTPSGFISLQVHGTKSKEPMRIRWRDIRIQDLGESGGITRSILGEVADTMGAAAPEGAVVLLDKKSGLGQWQNEGNPEKKIGWKLDDAGVLEVLPGDCQLVTKRDVRDFRLHLEFCVGEGAGNTGVYIQKRYEVQIMNTAGEKEAGPGDCGALYKTTAPRVNAARAAGQWQVFDIVFRAARWSADGEKTENARLSVVHNGVPIHDNTDVPNKTGAGLAEGPEDGPIRLQEHGDAVKFRNIWLADLSLDGIPHVKDYRFGTSSKALRAAEKDIRGANKGKLKWYEKWMIELIDSPETTREGKQFAGRMLEMVGTKDSLGALERLLSDEKSSHMARFALEGMPFAEVDAIFLKALDTTKGMTRVGVINSIGARGDRGAVEALGKIASGKDAEQAAVAIKALGKIGGPEAVSALDAARPASDHVNAPVWADAMLACGDSLLASGDAKGANAVYNKMTGEKNAIELRVAAFRGIIRANKDKAEVIISAMLRSDELELQWAAAKFLPEAPGELATKAFANESLSMKPAGRVALLTALGNRGDKLAAPAAAKALECDDETVRVAALNALAVLGGADDVQRIAQAAAAGGETAKAAEACLALINGEGVGQAIAMGSANGEWDVKTRLALIDAMAARAQTRGVGVLLRTAADENDRIRAASLKSLGVLAGEADFEALVALLATAEESADVKAREKAVAATASRVAVADADKAAQTLLDARKTASGEESRAALTRMLGRVGGAKALEAATASLKDENKAIREAAVRALADWPDAAPAAQLLEIAGSTEDEILHVLALRGYVRMMDGKRDQLEAAAKVARRDDEKKLIRDALAKIK